MEEESRKIALNLCAKITLLRLFTSSKHSFKNYVSVGVSSPDSALHYSFLQSSLEHRDFSWIVTIRHNFLFIVSAPFLFLLCDPSVSK